MLIKNVLWEAPKSAISIEKMEELKSSQSTEFSLFIRVINFLILLNPRLT